MFMEQYQQYQQEEVIVCNIFMNGQNMDQMSKIRLHKGATMGQIKDLLQRQWKIMIPQIRLFNQEGVEIFEEDLKFVKNDSKFYASMGEEFDTKTTFSEYKTIKILGEGGFGQVLLGQHRITHQKVAIKIVNTRMIGNAQDIDMVFREAELLKSLDHKNIVKIFNCYTLSNMQVVFIMEYLEGGELYDYLEETGPLKEAEARLLFIQVAEAMQYCHQRKLIHRDLKLENILLAKKNSNLIKIVDFGIAGIAINLNVEKINVGSLRYMAPETLTGHSRQIGPFIDVWAMGVILYTLVTGEMPFKGQTNKEILHSITSAQYQFPTVIQLSIELKDLISRIFILEPSKRIQLKDIIAHQWVKPHQENPFIKSHQIYSLNLELGTRTELQTQNKKVRMGQVTMVTQPPQKVEINNQKSTSHFRQTLTQFKDITQLEDPEARNSTKAPTSTKFANQVITFRNAPRKDVFSQIVPDLHQIPTQRFMVKQSSFKSKFSKQSSPIGKIFSSPSPSAKAFGFPKSNQYTHIRTESESKFFLPIINDLKTDDDTTTPKTLREYKRSGESKIPILSSSKKFSPYTIKYNNQK